MSSQLPPQRLVRLHWLADPDAVTIRIADDRADIVVRSGDCGETESEFNASIRRTLTIVCRPEESI